MVKTRRGETLIDFVVTVGGAIGAGILPVVPIKTTSLPHGRGSDGLPAVDFRSWHAFDVVGRVR